MTTMKDIARLSGYSRTTVSAVLGNKPGVSPRAVRKILDIVDRHNYRPNLMASTLVGKPSNLIGVVVRDMMNPYYTEIARGIESVISEAGYNILYFSTRESHEREIQAMQTLAAYQVEGLLLGPVIKNVDHDHIWLFTRNKIPLVTLEKIPGFDIDHVGFQDEKAGWLVADYLCKMGHRRVRFLAGPPTARSSEERLRGFQIGLTNHRVDFEDPLAVPCGMTSRDGYEAAMRLLRVAEGRPTALFCFSDLVAVGVYKAAHELGLRIPGEVSVVGVDDIELSSVLGPALTTVSFGIQEVGRFVARALLERIRRKAEGGCPPLEQIFIPRLVERESVARRDPD